MIRCLLVALSVFFFQQLTAQKFFTTIGKKNNQPRDCGLLIADLTNGSVNGLNPVASIEDIKLKLPCYTNTSPETSTENCGGGVFFANKHINFYTKLDCITIGTKFNGSVVFKKNEVQLLGATSSQVSSVLGREPDFFRNTLKPGTKSAVYTMSYGLIILNYLFDHVMEVNICNQKRSEIRVCE